MTPFMSLGIWEHISLWVKYMKIGCYFLQKWRCNFFSNECWRKRNNKIVLAKQIIYSMLFQVQNSIHLNWKPILILSQVPVCDQRGRLTSTLCYLIFIHESTCNIHKLWEVDRICAPHLCIDLHKRFLR